MLVRSAWAWIVLIASWASIVASKSPSVCYEMIAAYHVYNIAWQYKGADQRYIYPLLDRNPADDEDGRKKKLYNASYRSKGHRGSLANGKMTWEEFCVAWIKDNKITPDKIPRLDLNNIEATAGALRKVKAPNMVPVHLASGIPRIEPKKGEKDTNLKYPELLEQWSDMIVEARERVPLATIEKDLKAITLASEKARTFRLIEFRQKQYLGEDLKRVFPGMSVFGTTVHVPEFLKNFEVVDVPKTINAQINRRKMPDILEKALGWHQLPFDPIDDWRERFMLLADEYGREPVKRHAETLKQMSADERKARKSAISHRRILEVIKSLGETARDTPGCRGKVGSIW